MRMACGQESLLWGSDSSFRANGASVEQIRSILHFLEECSIPKVWEAFEVLNCLLINHRITWAQR
jgi:hypothetical protein